MIELIDARSLILKTVQKTSVILKRLKETLNYVLAEDIKSDINYPPFTRSKMDGFAVCSKELIQVSPNNPLILEILETVQAGVKPNLQLKSGQTAKIMTGAPLPEGADAVIPFEEVSWQGSKAAFTQKITAGQHLSFEGEEIKKGQLVLTKDKIIGPGELVILALSGKEKVKVYSRPRTGILVTGEEITDIGKKLEKAKIRDTNSCMLAGQVKLSGGYPVSLGITGDKKDEIAGIINSFLPELDLIITTGGAAAGEYDLTEEVFQSVGAEILFRRVAMKPGNYLVAAQKEGKFLFGLSGSPSGAFVSFEQLVRPLLWHMQGLKGNWRTEITASLKGSLRGSFLEDRYYKAHTYLKEGSCYETELKGSGLFSFTGVNSLVYVPKGQGPFKPGDKVKVQLLNPFGSEV